MSTETIISYFIAGAIVLASIYLGISTKLLKYGSTNPKAKYSFSHVQLMWWTVIISCSYIILFTQSDDFNLFNNSTLILLGIGSVTSAVASTIDISQKQTGKSLHQDDDSKGFFNDILSDENGISMHRLQAVIFNALFGIVFIIIMWTEKKFPDFENTQLALMGLSSGSYLALKTNENKASNAVTPPTPSSS